MWALEEIQLQKVAKDAIYGDISDEFNPFSEFKLCVNKYLLELWQSERDDFPENNCIFPKDRITCPRINRREDTVIDILQLRNIWREKKVFGRLLFCDRFFILFLLLHFFTSVF